MKKQLYKLGWLWLSFSIAIICVMLYQHRENVDKNKNFGSEIGTIIEYARSFKMANERPPSEGEFKDWQNSNNVKGNFFYINNDVSVPKADRKKFKGCDWTKDFAIGRARAGRNDYYFSNTNTYLTYTATSGSLIANALLLLFIGITPILLLWMIQRRK